MADMSHTIKQFWSKSEGDMLMSVSNRNAEILPNGFRHYVSQLLVMIFNRIDAAEGASGTVIQSRLLEIVAEAFNRDIKHVIQYTSAEMPELLEQETWGPDQFTEISLLMSLECQEITSKYELTCQELRARETLFSKQEHQEWLAQKIGEATMALSASKRQHFIFGLKGLAIIAAQLHEEMSEAHAKTKDVIRKVQKAAWENRDFHHQRSNEQALLPELRPGHPFAEKMKTSKRYQINHSEWDTLMTSLKGAGYESYQGNPKSEYEQNRMAMLEESAAQIEHREKLWHDLKAAEEEAALSDLMSRAAMAREKKEKDDARRREIERKEKEIKDAELAAQARMMGKDITSGIDN